MAVVRWCGAAVLRCCSWIDTAKHKKLTALFEDVAQLFPFYAPLNKFPTRAFGDDWPRNSPVSEWTTRGRIVSVVASRRVGAGMAWHGTTRQ